MQVQHSKMILVLVFTMAAGVAQAQTGQAPGAKGSTGAAAPTGTMTDSEIAHTLVTANTIDADAGKMASTKAQSKEVQSFAKQMVTDHTAVQKQVNDLAKKVGVTPKENPASQSMKTAANTTKTKLQKMTGKDFDKAYVENEVNFHQAVLDAIDNTLAPNAKNAELKTLISQVRPAIAAHLEHAKTLQQTVTK